MPRTGTADAIDSLLAHGRPAVTTQELAELLDVRTERVRMRMQPLQRDGRVFSPARGLWIPIPPEYRTWRVIPGIQFIDPMMNHLARDYYVGWLSAAEIYGAAHQRPQVLQVAVDRPVRDLDIERVRLRFAERRNLRGLPRRRRNVPTGQVWVSSPELTAFDLAADPARGGGISNVATVLLELTDENQLDRRQLVEVGESFSLAATRRLGFLLDSIDQHDLAEAIHPLVERRRNYPSDLLAPSSPTSGDIDGRWQIRVNAEVEPDL